MVWDRVWQKSPYRDPRKRVTRAARRLRLLGVIENVSNKARLLDLGCGGGENLLLLSKRVAAGVELVGVDISPEAVGRSAQVLAGRAAVSVADGRALPFPDSHFTDVTMFGVMEHIPDVDSLLGEIHRVLIPSGRLYITTSNRYSLIRATSFFRKVVGAFPFGYQKDWTATQISEFLNPFFALVRVQVVGADWDMPAAKLTDRLLNLIIPVWGRYLFVEAVK
jgi:SAM-dependent methyltransferase